MEGGGWTAKVAAVSGTGAIRPEQSGTGGVRLCMLVRRLWTGNALSRAVPVRVTPLPE